MELNNDKNEQPSMWESNPKLGKAIIENAKKLDLFTPMTTILENYFKNKKITIEVNNNIYEEKTINIKCDEFKDEEILLILEKSINILNNRIKENK